MVLYFKADIRGCARDIQLTGAVPSLNPPADVIILIRPSVARSHGLLQKRTSSGIVAQTYSASAKRQSAEAQWIRRDSVMRDGRDAPRLLHG